MNYKDKWHHQLPALESEIQICEGTLLERIWSELIKIGKYEKLLWVKDVGFFTEFMLRHFKEYREILSANDSCN